MIKESFSPVFHLSGVYTVPGLDFLCFFLAYLSFLCYFFSFACQHLQLVVPCCASLRSHIQLSVTLWTHGEPVQRLCSWGFSRQEYWSGLPCPGSMIQGIFPTQGLNPGLPHCGRILYCLSHQGSPRILE